MITSDQLKDVLDRADKLKHYLKIDEKKIEFEEEDLRTQAPDFWEDQKRAEEQMKKVGLKDDNAFSCAAYLPEIGNTPKEGDILSVSVKNTNTTLAQNIRSIFYSVSGSGASQIAAQHSGVVTANAKD